MHLNREALLRELELWPLWRVRQPAQPAVPELAQAATPSDEIDHTHVSAPVTIARQQTELADASAPLTPELAGAVSAFPPLDVAAEATSAALPKHADTDVQSEDHAARIEAPAMQPAAHPQTIPKTPPAASPPIERPPPASRDIAFAQPSAPLSMSATPSSVAQVQAYWLLHAHLPHAAALSADCMTLLQNIARVVAPPGTQVLVHTAPLTAAQVQAKAVLLFGLAAANAFLSTHHEALDASRGQVIRFAGGSLVVTHAPEALLQNPMLKAEVWQDICLLLAALDTHPSSAQPSSAYASAAAASSADDVI